MAPLYSIVWFLSCPTSSLLMHIPVISKLLSWQITLQQVILPICCFYLWRCIFRIRLELEVELQDIRIDANRILVIDRAWIIFPLPPRNLWALFLQSFVISMYISIITEDKQLFKDHCYSFLCIVCSRSCSKFLSGFWSFSSFQDFLCCKLQLFSPYGSDLLGIHHEPFGHRENTLILSL